MHCCHGEWFGVSEHFGSAVGVGFVVDECFGWWIGGWSCFGDQRGQVVVAS